MFLLVILNLLKFAISWSDDVSAGNSTILTLVGCIRAKIRLLNIIGKLQTCGFNILSYLWNFRVLVWNHKIFCLLLNFLIIMLSILSQNM